MPSWLVDTINAVAILPAWARLLTLFFSTLIEYIFPIFPGDTIVIAAGFFDSQEALDASEVFLAIALGTLVGSSLTFGLGRALALGYFKHPWLEQLINSDHMQLFNRWYKRYGYGLLLGNRFFPGVRSFFFVAAGFSRLGLGQTLSLGIISGLIFNGGLYWLGLSLGNNIEDIIQILKTYTAIAYSVLGLAVFLWAAWWFYPRR